MKNSKQVKWSNSDFKLACVIAAILLLLKAIGALDYKLDGYSIEEHLSSWSLFYLFCRGGWELLWKILD